MIDPYDFPSPVPDVDWSTSVKIAFWAGFITLFLGFIYLVA